MEDDHCFVGSTTNILSELSSDDDRIAGNTSKSGQQKKREPGKKAELTRSQAIQETGRDHAHSNPAFVIDEDDDFVVVDNMGSTINPFRKQEVEEDLIDDTRPPSHHASTHDSNSFGKKSTEGIELGKVDAWGEHGSADDSKPNLIPDDRLEVRVVDPHLPKKLSSVLSPQASQSDPNFQNEASSKENIKDGAPTIFLSPSKLQSDSSQTVDDEGSAPSAVRKRPLLVPHSHFISEDVTDGRFNRPQSRSPALTHSQSLKVPNPRTQSTREEGQTKTRKSRKLLRDLSFSDADAKTIQNYGSLKNASALPRRKLPPSGPSIDADDDEEDDEDEPLTIPNEVILSLKKLMEELVRRGKVEEVAVVDQDGCRMVVSHPSWSLSKGGVSGIVKAVMGTQQILKLFIDGELYTCFKHGPKKLVARTGDNILVAQRSESFVVVAHALDDTPGSCLYEVAELVDALVEKGW